MKYVPVDNDLKIIKVIYSNTKTKLTKTIAKMHALKGCFPPNCSYFLPRNIRHQNFVKLPLLKVTSYTQYISKNWLLAKLHGSEKLPAQKFNTKRRSGAVHTCD